MVARSGLDCALGLEKEDAGRGRGGRGDGGGDAEDARPAGVGAAADDVSTSYLSLIQARKDAGDAAGATKDAEAWAAFLEAQAAAAKTPEQRAVFDSHRLSAYLELKQPERAIPMLQESEKDLPGRLQPAGPPGRGLPRDEEARRGPRRLEPRAAEGRRPAAHPRAADAVGHLRGEGRRRGGARGPRAGPRLRGVAAGGPALGAHDRGPEEEAGGDRRRSRRAERQPGKRAAVSRSAASRGTA